MEKKNLATKEVAQHHAGVLEHIVVMKLVPSNGVKAVRKVLKEGGLEGLIVMMKPAPKGGVRSAPGPLETDQAVEKSLRARQ